MLDRIFDMENSFWTFANKLADVVVLELLWLITSLPLFTIGAASSAFWHVVLRLAEDEEGRLFPNYFNAFRKSFKTGTAVWGLQFGLGLFLLLDLCLCFRMEQMIAVFLAGTFGALTLLWLMVSVYLYPLTGRFNFSVKKIVSNSAFLAMKHLPHTVCLVILPAAALVGSYFISYAVIILPALAFYLDARLLNWIFSRYIEDEDP